MSVQSIQNQIKSIQNDIKSLRQKLTTKSREEATKFNQINQIRKSITKYTSQSLVESKHRQITQLELDIGRIKSDISDINQQITAKSERLHQYEQNLYKEQAKEQEKFLKSLEQKQKEEARRQQSALANMIASSQSSPFETRMSLMNQEAIKPHDVFISHASEDKQEIARPLADALIALGYKVWYDEFQLKIGDSLRRSIDKGLANSRFGIVILSPNFFAKNWTQYELDGLVQREMVGGKIILPIWHKISKDEIMFYSPSLVDKKALNTAQYTIEELAKAISEVLALE